MNLRNLIKVFSDPDAIVRELEEIRLDIKKEEYEYWKASKVTKLFENIIAADIVDSHLRAIDTGDKDSSITAKAYKNVLDYIKDIYQEAEESNEDDNEDEEDSSSGT